jgi:hypothetical protein
MSQWDTDEQGEVIVFSVLGWHAAPAFETSRALRIRFAANDEELETGGRAIQLVMGPAQAEQLASDLLAIAKHLTTIHPPGRRTN